MNRTETQSQMVLLKNYFLLKELNADPLFMTMCNFVLVGNSPDHLKPFQRESCNNVTLNHKKKNTWALVFNSGLEIRNHSLLE